MRPFHAGLIGQDALIVHDEAHLSPAFGKLVRDVRFVQQEAGEPRPIRVIELSATSRGRDLGANAFSLTPHEEAEPIVERRLNASKRVRWIGLPNGESLVETLAAAAIAHSRDRVRVVAFVNRPENARRLAGLLSKEVGPDRVAILTGTIRGYERDLMTLTPLASIDNPLLRRRAEIFLGFHARPSREFPTVTEYLVATSAGEVGIDLDADHMVSDLTTLDSMVQRLGRVNRLGEASAHIGIFEAMPAADDSAGKDRAERIAHTRTALLSLPANDEGHDASPVALRELIRRLVANQTGSGAVEVDACFSRMPRIVKVTDILLDGWAMTRVEDLPGVPPVERWLHGVTSEEPSLFVAWRDEVGALDEAADPVAAATTLFDRHPVLGRERVRGNLQDVVDELNKIGRRLGESRALLLPARGVPVFDALAGLLARDNADQLREATLVLPLDAGALTVRGCSTETRQWPFLMSLISGSPAKANPIGRGCSLIVATKPAHGQRGCSDQVGRSISGMSSQTPTPFARLSGRFELRKYSSRCGRQVASCLKAMKKARRREYFSFLRKEAR
jgi:CRISPR-associated endonuclease/helicase Cas3